MHSRYLTTKLCMPCHVCPQLQLAKKDKTLFSDFVIFYLANPAIAIRANGSQHVREPVAPVRPARHANIQHQMSVSLDMTILLPFVITEIQIPLRI